MSPLPLRAPLREGVRGRGHAIVIATKAEIQAALAAGATVLVTAPGLAHAAGPAWIEAVAHHAGGNPQIVHDVGDDAALGHVLLTAGRDIVFTGPQRWRDTLVATFPGRVWRGIARSGRLR